MSNDARTVPGQWPYPLPLLPVASTPPRAYAKPEGPEYPTQDAAIEAARERGLTLCGRTLIYTRESGLCAVLHYVAPGVSPS